MGGGPRVITCNQASVNLNFSDIGDFESVLICAQGTAIFIEGVEQYLEIVS
jgi:hypothetical protein